MDITINIWFFSLPFLLAEDFAISCLVPLYVEKDVKYSVMCLYADDLYSIVLDSTGSRHVTIYEITQ